MRAATMAMSVGSGGVVRSATIHRSLGVDVAPGVVVVDRLLAVCDHFIERPDNLGGRLKLAGDRVVPPPMPCEYEVLAVQRACDLFPTEQPRGLDRVNPVALVVLLLKSPGAVRCICRGQRACGRGSHPVALGSKTCQTSPYGMTTVPMWRASVRSGAGFPVPTTANVRV